MLDASAEDFTQGEPRCDLILDNVASHSFDRCGYAAVETHVHAYQAVKALKTMLTRIRKLSYRPG